MNEDLEPNDAAVREAVRQRYAEAAGLVMSGKAHACCSGDGPDPITTDLYDASESGEVPELAARASLGCGNPTALADLHEGETVLDLGSGGGMDVLLSARRVGPTGFAYGLDMTDEMLELAELNRRETGLANVRFLKGHIEDIPLPADTVDVVISNCVINLSADKGRVLREAFRVLKPGGRLAVSDMVWTRPAPESVRKNADMWAGCVAGALLESDYRSLLADSGFEDVTVTAMRSFDVPGSGCCDESCGSEVRGAGRVGTQDAPLVSAFIRAVKPQG